MCGTFYVDSDGDGYGTSASIQRCGTTVPSGHADKSGDCCDIDTHAHPGSTTTLATADVCGSFDYNCDGNETPKSNGPSDCGAGTCGFVEGKCQYTGGCTCGGSSPCTTYTTAACGQAYYTSVLVCAIMGGNCVGFTNGGPYAAQACN